MDELEGKDLPSPESWEESMAKGGWQPFRESKNHRRKDLNTSCGKLRPEFRVSTSPLKPTHAVLKCGSPDLEGFQAPFHPREWTFDLRHQSVLIIFHEVKGEVKDNYSNNYNSSWS